MTETPLDRLNLMIALAKTSKTRADFDRAFAKRLPGMSVQQIFRDAAETLNADAERMERKIQAMTGSSGGN